MSEMRSHVCACGRIRGILHSTSPPTQIEHKYAQRFGVEQIVVSEDELPVVNTMPKNIQLEMQHHSIIIQQITGKINGYYMGPLTTKVKNYKVRECVGS